MNLTTQQIKENEKYFQQVINVLGEGGVFGWKSTAEVCIKRNGKLICPKKSYDIAKGILSTEFFVNHFDNI